MATNNNIFVIDDGTKPITLQNQYGQEIATLYIRISDIGIVDRYREMAKDLEKAIVPLKDIALNNDGTATFEKDWALLKQVEKEIIDRINALFDITNAADIFRTRNAFSSIGGEFFVEKVLAGIGNIISSGIEEEAKKAQRRTNKYTKDLEKRG